MADFILVYMFALIAFGAFLEAYENCPPHLEGKHFLRICGSLAIGVCWPGLIGMKIVQDF